jgi:hypothetical protein
MQVKLCYFNQHWNIYLYTGTNKGFYDAPWINIKPTEQVIVRGDEGEYRLRTYSHPDIPVLCSFGFWYYDEKRRPGHGGEWSSNSRVINEVFGTDLYEVALDQISMAVSLKWLKEVLGDKVVWEPDDIWGSIITHVKGEKNEHDKWVTIPLVTSEDLIVNN